MNIYEGEEVDAIVDLRAAAAELKASPGITNDGVRRRVVAEIQTAALLDIALSLRVVAAEARAAMPSPLVETAPEIPAERDFFIVGDLVAVNGHDEPAEITGFGQSEGALYADVLFANGAESRAWLDTLTRLVGDERDDDAMQEATERIAGAVAEASAFTSDEIESGIAPVELEPADLVDDIDNDFDGDHHPAAASALDVLKANEAARKAAKKGSKK